MRTRWVATGMVLACACLAGAVPQRPSASPAPAAVGAGPILAVVGQGAASRLARLDPMTLAPLARGLAIGDFQGGWARSPGGTRVALVSRRAIRVVDTRRMRVVQRMYGVWDDMDVLWPTPGRIMVLDPISPSVEGIGNGRQVWTRTFDGVLAGRLAVPGGIALLLAPDGGIGPATIAVVSADGTVRSTVLDRVAIGMAATEDPGVLPTVSTPGFAVDGSGTRAYVVPAGSSVAEIDLATLDVTYHEFSHWVSLLGRLHDWLEPKAGAKGENGPSRSANVLGDGLLAVSGSDEQAWFDADGNIVDTSTPTGLQIVDMHDWTVRSVDETTSGTALTGNLLIAYGVRYDSRNRSQPAYSLDVYGPDGKLVRHTDWDWWDGTAGGLGYASVDNALVVVDPATGAVLATPKIPANRSLQLLIS